MFALSRNSGYELIIAVKTSIISLNVGYTLNYMGTAEPKRIGFLATQFDEYYQNLVFHGALEEARRYPVQLIFYEGSNTETLTKSGALDDTAFNLAAKTRLDGLIVMTNTMGSSFSRERIAGYLASFSHMPIVSIGLEFDNVYTLRPQAGCGMVQLTSHLVEVHHRRRFLFLAGPEGHPESEARKSEFLHTLSELLPEAEPVILYADFLEERAYETTIALIEGHWNFDAVVAANDQMAFGSIRALEEHGIRVPAQVSVTGFDDIPYSVLSIPALTTIHQPTSELGRRAIGYLATELGLGSSEPTSMVADLSTSFVIRQSCGCMNGGTGDAASTVDQLQMRLRNLFSLQVGERSRSAFLRRIEAAVVRTFKLEEILVELSHGLKRLGIRFAAVVMVDERRKNTSRASLFMLLNGEEVQIFTPNGQQFSTRSLLPQGLPKDFQAYVCESLQFGSEQMGYFICTPDAKDMHVYASLRDLITTSMKGALIMSLEKDRELILQREVHERTGELVAANKQLKREIAQRKELEQELLEVSNNIMTRIGQDIHDDLCQDLAALGMLAATLESALKKTELAGARQLAKNISESALKSAYTAKQIARDLFPSDLQDNGFVASVMQLVKSKNVTDGNMVTLEIQPGFHIDDKQQAIQLYRIIQEALNNALKHAKATRITVNLLHDEQSATVEVVDDGVGFEVKKGRTASGMGMKILTYRANLIGGDLHIASSPSGTVVSCRVSLQEGA